MVVTVVMVMSDDRDRGDEPDSFVHLHTGGADCQPGVVGTEIQRIRRSLYQVRRRRVAAEQEREEIDDEIRALELREHTLEWTLDKMAEGDGDVDGGRR